MATYNVLEHLRSTTQQAELVVARVKPAFQGRFTGADRHATVATRRSIPATPTLLDTAAGSGHDTLSGTSDPVIKAP
jgi:hypothetical protein